MYKNCWQLSAFAFKSALRLEIIFPLAFYSIAFLGGCQSATTRPTALILEHDATLRYLDGKQFALKAKIPFSVEPGQPAYLEAPLRTPVLLTPLLLGRGELRVSLKPLDAQSSAANAASQLENKAEQGAAQKANKKEQTALVNDALNGVNDVQKLVLQKRYDDAGIKMGNLRTRYPEVSFLDILEANIFVAKDQLPQAVELLENAVSKNPEDFESKRLLKTLKEKQSGRKN